MKDQLKIKQTRWSSVLTVLTNGMEGTGGKSELHRTQCSVTRSPGDGKESATENIPFRLFDGIRVKWRGRYRLNVRAHRSGGDIRGMANPTGRKAK